MTSINSDNYNPGEPYSYDVTGAPNSDVWVTVQVMDPTTGVIGPPSASKVGTTDASGRFTATGTIPNQPGQWNLNFTVGGNTAGTLNFTVNPPPTQQTITRIQDGHSYQVPINPPVVRQSQQQQQQVQPQPQQQTQQQITAAQAYQAINDQIMRAQMGPTPSSNVPTGSVNVVANNTPGSDAVQGNSVIPTGTTSTTNPTGGGYVPPNVVDDLWNGFSYLFKPTEWGTVFKSGNAAEIVGLLALPLVAAFMFNKYSGGRY